MTNWGNSTTIRCLSLGMLTLAATSWTQTRPHISEQIAKAYGLDAFGQVDAIRYTWNAQFPGVNVSHSWVWEPKTGQVSYEGKDKDGKPVKATYIRSQLASQPANVRDEIEPSFVNDNYWLIFPLHAYWDSSADIQDLGVQKLPLANGEARRVAVKYPAEAGGYTPGDIWELFVGTDWRVEEFIYHRGGPKKPSVVTATWAGYKKAGPLLISTDHRGTADGKPLRIFISDLSVKLVGSDKWVNAQ